MECGLDLFIGMCYPYWNMKHTVKILIECKNNISYREIEEFLWDFKSNLSNAEGNCEGITVKWEEVKDLGKKEV